MQLRFSFHTAGDGCLEFAYHMFGRSREMGTLTVKLSSGSVLFREARNRGSRWRRRQISVSLPNGNNDDGQVRFDNTMSTYAHEYAVYAYRSYCTLYCTV